MRILGFTWGIGGVLCLLLFAIYRLTPIAFELESSVLNGLQWFALLACVFAMAYAEGYRGFHKAFAPRVVVRANYLKQHPRILHVILAPLFCMGFIHATPRRRLVSISVSTMVICLILIVRLLPQPWRGIVDAGVVVGLFLGICSIVFFLLQLAMRPELLTQAAEVPATNSNSARPDHG